MSVFATGVGAVEVDYLANIKAVNTAREGMQIQNDVHAILLNSVICNLLEVLLLVARVVSSSWYLDPCCIRGRNTDKIHSTRCKFIYVLCRYVPSVTLLKDRVALVSQLNTTSPFINSVSAVLVPPVWINVSFLSQPSSEVDTVGTELSPINVIILLGCGRACHNGRGEDKEENAKG